MKVIVIILSSFCLMGCGFYQRYILYNSSDKDIIIQGRFAFDTWSGSWQLSALGKVNKLEFNGKGHYNSMEVPESLSYNRIIGIPASQYYNVIPQNKMYGIFNTPRLKLGVPITGIIVKPEKKWIIHPGGFFPFGYRNKFFWASLRKKEVLIYSMLTPMIIIADKDTIIFNNCEIDSVPTLLRPRTKFKRIKGMIVAMEYWGNNQ